MGDLILLDQRREAHRPGPTLSATRPTFFFDLACPLSYLAAERVERTLGDAQWVPVSVASLAETGAGGVLPPLQELREQVEYRAQRLRLPLVWPERFPAQTPRALRAAVHAAGIVQGEGAVSAALGLLREGRRERPLAPAG